jgi:acetolactate synthase regulatory subunit
MIIEVFVAQSQPVNALSEQLLHTMFDVAGVTVVDETVGQGSDEPAVAFQFA